MHDQAEDRCHRIGQHDAVTAWYLLAAETIDETMIELIARKRGIVGAVTDGRRDESEALVQSRRARAARRRPRRPPARSPRASRSARPLRLDVVARLRPVRPSSSRSIRSDETAQFGTISGPRG